MNITTKTPVSSLQEYLVKKNLSWRYELTRSCVGTSSPEFTIRVYVGDLYEDGTGRSKQVAKHRAAENMLKTLKKLNSDGGNKDTTEVEMDVIEDAAFDNYVGQLKEFVAENHYPEAKFYLEEEAGPPHAKIFKMICGVSQLQDFGISKTKKQAKQQAALKMLERLKELHQTNKNTHIKSDLPAPKVITQIPEISLTDDEIHNKYCSIKTSSVIVAQDPAALYKDHYRAYEALVETSQTLLYLIQNSGSVTVFTAFSYIQDIATELKVELTTTECTTKSNTGKAIFMTLSVAPPMAGFGPSEEDAAFNLLNSLVFFFTQ